MAQRRYWNRDDDDSTFDLNFRELGIIEAGRYRGFDAVLSAGLNLVLNQLTTGASKTALGGASVGVYGIWYSRQGAVITEDAAIAPLPIAAGDATHPRIDLIIGYHTYINVSGGAAATYSVITGTPAASPVAPALTIPNLQVILGYLYVPANTVNLNGAGVVYTQAAVPNYGNDATIAHTNLENIFSELQTVRGLEENLGTATLDTATNATVIFLKDNAAAVNDNNQNVYLLSTTSTPTIDYRVTAISNIPTPAVGNVRRITIISPTISIRFDAAFFGRNYFLKAGSAVTIAYDNAGNYYFEEDDNASLGRVNRFWKQQIFNNKQSSVGTLASGLVSLSPDFNVYSLGNGASPNDIVRGISASQTFDQGTTLSALGGGVCWLIAGGTDTVRVQPFDFSVPAGFKPIWAPTNFPFCHVRTNEPIMFVEDALFWRMVTPQSGWYDVPLTVSAVAGGGSVTPTGANILRVMYSNNCITINAFLTLNIVGTVNTFDINLALAYNWKMNTIFWGGIGGASPINVFSVLANSASILRMGIPSGTFPAGVQILRFSGNFELDT